MNVQEVMENMSLLSPITLATGCVLGIVSYVKNSLVGKLIFWYLAIMLSIDILSRYFGRNADYNLFLLSVSGLVDILFFSWLYVKYFRISFRIPLLVISALAEAGVLATLFFNTNEIIAEFQSYDKVVCDGVLFVYALISMLDLLRGKGELKREIVRINIAVLLFFSLDMLMSLVINFLLNAGIEFLVFFWMLRLALMLTLYIILIYTLWQTGKNPKRWQYG